MNDERCELCRFYEAGDADDKSAGGWCRRYPPVLITGLTAAYYLEEFVDGESRFVGCDDPLSPYQSPHPWVESSEWCGEFQPLPPE